MVAQEVQTELAVWKVQLLNQPGTVHAQVGV